MKQSKSSSRAVYKVQAKKIKAYDKHKLLPWSEEAKFNRSQKYYIRIVYYGFVFFKRILAKPTPQKWGVRTKVKGNGEWLIYDTYWNISNEWN